MQPKAESGNAVTRTTTPGNGHGLLSPALRPAGGTWFFTVTLRDRRSNLLLRRIDLLRTAWAHTARERPFRTEAVVILPDHLHAIWTLPPGDTDYPGRWRALESRYVRTLTGTGEALRRNHRGEACTWQRRYWEHTLRDDADFATHVDYIHFNPVRHGLVERPSDWSYSSIHRFFARGDLPADWGGPPEEIAPPDTGEPSGRAAG
jgi:putative transposase